jgi:membrane protein DedA with SNARE-associated domain
MSMGATLFTSPHSVKPSFYPYSIGKVAVRDWVMFKLGLRFGRAVLLRWSHAIEVERLGQLRCVIRLRSPRACLLQRTLAVEVERL